MVWYANSPVISVLLATGIAWIAPQFLVACTGYSIVMFLFVIIVRAFAGSFFWTSEVWLFATSLALGYLAIIVSSVIRGFVYHIINRAMKIANRKEAEVPEYSEHSYGQTYMHYMHMIASTHDWMIPGFNRFFYNTFAIVMGIVWALLITGTAWFFFYYEYMTGVWPWCFLLIGIAAIAALVVFVVEYQVTEKKVEYRPNERNKHTANHVVESYARICGLAAIVLQFPVAMGLYLMFYMIFHPMAWFDVNESVIVLMAMASYVVVNIPIVYLASHVFSTYKRRVSRSRRDTIELQAVFA